MVQIVKLNFAKLVTYLGRQELVIVLLVKTVWKFSIITVDLLAIA